MREKTRERTVYLDLTHVNVILLLYKHTKYTHTHTRTFKDKVLFLRRAEGESGRFGKLDVASQLKGRAI